MLMPGLKVFLDVDNLSNLHELETLVESSAVVVFFLSQGFFSSGNVLREVRAAVESRRHICVVYETSAMHGGVPLELLRMQCEGCGDPVVSAATPLLFEDCERVEPRAAGRPVAWYRERSYLNASLLALAERLRSAGSLEPERPAGVPASARTLQIGFSDAKSTRLAGQMRSVVAEMLREQHLLQLRPEYTKRQLRLLGRKPEDGAAARGDTPGNTPPASPLARGRSALGPLQSSGAPSSPSPGARLSTLTSRVSRAATARAEELPDGTRRVRFDRSVAGLFSAPLGLRDAEYVPEPSLWRSAGTAVRLLGAGARLSADAAEEGADAEKGAAYLHGHAQGQGPPPPQLLLLQSDTFGYGCLLGERARARARRTTRGAAPTRSLARARARTRTRLTRARAAALCAPARAARCAAQTRACSWATCSRSSTRAACAARRALSSACRSAPPRPSGRAGRRAAGARHARRPSGVRRTRLRRTRRMRRAAARRAGGRRAPASARLDSPRRGSRATTATPTTTASTTTASATLSPWCGSWAASRGCRCECTSRRTRR